MQLGSSRWWLSVLALWAWGCGQDAEVEERVGDPTCAADAVEVSFGGASWCAHHDVGRFTCPAQRPHRQAFRGVAFCGVGPVDEATAERVARAALRSGRVLEAREVVGFQVPAEWRGAPGADAGQALTLQVDTRAASNVSWISADGDPELCVRTFDRIEVEQQEATVRVTAWDRVRCAPDAVGAGLVVEETWPGTLPPLAPGRYRLSGSYPDGDAPLIVALDDACPDRPPVDGCFRGAFFADCGGSALPAGIWCAEGGRCLWAACPPVGYDRAVECGDRLYCPWPHESWGAEPWTRDRDMALAVELDEALAADVALDCSAATDITRLHAMCGPEQYPVRQSRVPSADSPRWGLPSLVAVSLLHAPDEGLLSEERILQLEIDFYAAEGPRARACVIATSDGGADGPPACASSGRLVIDRVVETLDDVAALRGRLHAEFPDFPLAPSCPQDCTVRGLVIDAAF